LIVLLIQNHSHRQQLARELQERVQVDHPLDEAMLENQLRARLDKLDRSVVVSRCRGLVALRPLPAHTTNPSKARKFAPIHEIWNVHRV
jgi:hypothetical protein